MKEEWKIIENFEDYQVSNYGNVRSLKRKRIIILNPRLSADGYLRVSLSKNGKSYENRIHQLVINHFGAKEKKETVNHIDGNKKNNNINNLEWADRSYQMKHAYKLGLKKPVSNNILTDEEVIKIRRYYIPHSKKCGMEVLAKTFNVSNSTIMRIIRGTTYKHLL